MKFQGLTKKISLWIGIPVLVVFILGAILLRLQVGMLTSEDVKNNILTKSDLITEQATDFFNGYASLTEQLATDAIYEKLILDSKYYGTNMHENAVFRLAYDSINDVWLGDNQNIINVFFASFERNELISTGGLVTMRDMPDFVVNDRDWAKQVKAEGKTIYTEPYVDANSGKVVCSIVSPIYQNDTSNIIGAAAVDLSLNELLLTFEKMQIGENGYVDVFLPDDTIFYDPDSSLIGEDISALNFTSEVEQNFASGDYDTTISFKAGSQDMMGSAAEIGSTGWKLLTILPKEEANAVVNSVITRIAITIAISFILIICLLVIIARKISAPLQIASSLAERIAVGDLEFEISNVKEDPTDEIEELRLAFDKMTKATKEQTNILESIAKGNLEIQVVPRSDNDKFSFALAHLIKVLDNVVDEINELTQQAILGDTKHRGNIEKFEGGYKRIITGFNTTIDVIMNVVDKLDLAIEHAGRGDIMHLENDQQGDYAKMIDGLNATMTNIQKLIDDTMMLAEAAISEDFDKRANPDVHKGEFNKIIKDINKMLDTVVDKKNWYEAILDCVPLPVQVMDNDMNWTFMNTRFADALKKHTNCQGKSDCGKSCSNIGLPFCGTEKCGIKSLINTGERISYFNWNGMEIKQETTYLKDKNGNNIGYVETIQDLSSVMKVTAFVEKEVMRLQQNLTNIAIGNFDFNRDRTEADEYTQETAMQFTAIDDSLEQVKEAIEMLIADVAHMTQESVAGNLSYRADISRFNGEYAQVMNGINQVLDAVIEPIGEATDVMKELARGNLSKEVVGHYNGDHAAIKEALNATIFNMRGTIHEIGQVLEEVGDGNLTVEISDNYQGDYIAIKRSLENIVAKLKDVMINLNEASDQVAGGSRQLSEASQTLASGSTEQASAIQQLTASITQIASQTKQNADDAGKASDLANEVKKNAEIGNGQMQQMLKSMDEINESSANISKIIKVIDDIAFQTNILALNAAVEAARAGVHGKGFAVVAEEVRNLAARSADAAKETTDLIEGSIKKVEVGTKIANDTAEALGDIVEGIDKAAVLVEGIARASNEQATAILQVDQGIEQVSDVVQSNSATAEESAASSEELYSQADMLKKMVASFKLDDGSHSLYQTKSPQLGAGQSHKSAQSNEFEEDYSISLDFDNSGNDKY